MIKRVVISVSWIILLAVLVLAASPTTPTTTTPTSRYFGSNTVDLTCTGATHPDNNLINYTFFRIKDTNNETNLHHSGSGSLTEGTSYVNPHIIDGDASGADVVRMNLSFSKELWVIPMSIRPRNSLVSAAIIEGYTAGQGDGNVLFNFTNKLGGSDTVYDKRNWTINVSAYDDGLTHNITFYIKSSGANGAIWRFWWNTSNTTRYSTRGDMEVLQNTSATTYTQDLNLLPAFTWGCRACDKDQNCSGFTTNKTIQHINFTFCNWGATGQSLNISFKDESNNSILNATAIVNYDYSVRGGNIFSGVYTATKDNLSYYFCLNPSWVETTVTPTITYSRAGYQQRVFKETFNLNSTLTNKVLYMLGDDNGIFVTFQVLSSADQPLRNVKVTGQRKFSGDFETIVSDTTNAAGAATFWLNPNINHQFIFNLSGYPTYTTELYPTQSSYTITLGSTGINDSNYNRGIFYKILPSNPVLNNNTQYDFSFNITSSFYNLTRYGFTLFNSTGHNLSTVNSTGAIGGFVNSSFITEDNTKITMNYFWEVNGTIANGTKSWVIMSTYQGTFSLKTFFDDLKLFSNSGFNGFTRALLAFGIILLVILSIGLLAGELPIAATMGVITAMVWLFEYVELLDPIGVKYFMTGLLGLVTIAYMIKESTR